jgi:hypothetical protein
MLRSAILAVAAVAVSAASIPLWRGKSIKTKLGMMRARRELKRIREYPGS